MTGWRLFFWVAAAFNVVVGLSLLLAPEALLSAFGQAVPSELLYHRFTGLLVLCFGAVYAFVASDLMRYRPLVWLGVAGKLGVVALFTEAYLAQRVPFSAYAVSLGDLAFAALFVVFLFATARRT
jgi:uncharacterized protein YjeT (DUF2065 family)